MVTLSVQSDPYDLSTQTDQDSFTALRQSYDYPSASYLTLAYMGKTNWYLTIKNTKTLELHEYFLEWIVYYSSLKVW